MTKDLMLRLLAPQAGPFDWVQPAIAFLESNETVLLSDKAGTYAAYGLLRELQRRFKRAKASSIHTIGMVDLINTLGSFSGEEIVRNYIFKNDQQTGIFYVDENETKLIGVVLVGGHVTLP